MDDNDVKSKFIFLVLYLNDTLLNNNDFSLMYETKDYL